MKFLKKIATLEDLASGQLAKNLCQEKYFKEVSLCLELTNLEVITKSQHETSKENKSIYAIKEYSNDDIKVKKWEAAVNEKCQKLMEGLNRFLKQKVHTWMIRISLEYLSFGRRQEKVFGVPRYFWLNSLSLDDWTENCRLDEVKIAKRLLKDERLTILQRYRIACVYCLLENISELCKKLTKNEKASINRQSDHHSNNRLVKIWTCNWNGDETITLEQSLLIRVVKELVKFGNLANVVQFWKQLEKPVRDNLVIDLAVKALREWQHAKQESMVYTNLIRKSVSDEPQYSYSRFNLSSHYNELIYFFLTEMHEKQQLAFFENCFSSGYLILHCFLDWPLQDFLLSLINRLWGKVPMDMYTNCLLILASKYSGEYSKIHEIEYFCKSRLFAEDNCNYDYRTLLEKLWEVTPEEYKQFIFSGGFQVLEGSKKFMTLLSRLVKRFPFQERDYILFKRVWHYFDGQRNIFVMYTNYGMYICSAIIQQQNWTFLNWLLEDCLGKNRSSYLKQFLSSNYGMMACFYDSYDNHEKFLEELFNWAFDSDSEKKIFKDQLINGSWCFDTMKLLLCEGKFTEVDCVINFCIASQVMRNHFKVNLVYRICSVLLQSCEWKQMDGILSWCFRTKKNIGDFKKDLFSCEGMQTHFALLFSKKQMKNVEDFYQWFQLSATKIKNIKKDTIFTADAIQYVKDWLCSSSKQKILLEPLNWCLTDEKTAIDFKIKVEECLKLDDEENKCMKKRLEDFINKLISGFKKEVLEGNVTKQSSSVRNKSKKRCAEVNDESKPPKKRLK